MKKKAILGLLLSFLIIMSVNGQFLDNYGLNFGTGYSNQYWQYKDERFANQTEWKEYMISFSGRFFAEKYLSRYISVRPSIGYIQKGFMDDVTLTFREDEEISVEDKRVVLHNLSFDFTTKIIPFNGNINPYFLLGLRADYLLDYKSIIINFQGHDHELNSGLYDDFDKFVYSGIIGAGISFKELLFLGFEYNPAITKNFESDGLAIHNRYFNISLGLNINQLMK